MKENESARGVIEASGGLVWRTTGPDLELALVHRARYDDWSLPKGKLHHGESWQEAAIREVLEETGCRVNILGFAGCSWYQLDGMPKVVLYWNMETVDEGIFHSNEETDELVWLSLSQALRRMSYEGERELVRSNADDRRNQ